MGLTRNRFASFKPFARYINERLDEELNSLARMYSAFSDRSAEYTFMEGAPRMTLVLSRAARLGIEALYRKMNLWDSAAKIPGALHIAGQVKCVLSQPTNL